MFLLWFEAHSLTYFSSQLCHMLTHSIVNVAFAYNLKLAERIHDLTRITGFYVIVVGSGSMLVVVVIQCLITQRSVKVICG